MCTPSPTYTVNCVTAKLDGTEPPSAVKTHAYATSPPGGVVAYGLPCASAGRTLTMLGCDHAATSTPAPYTSVWDKSGSPGLTMASHGEPVSASRRGSPRLVTNVIASRPALAHVKLTVNAPVSSSNTGVSCGTACSAL